jgi:hypothetical protein
MKKMLVSAAAAFLLPIGVAHAVDQPERKEGLWSIHMQTIPTAGNDESGNKTSKTTESSQKICRSHAFDEYARSVEEKGNKDRGCTTISESFRDGKYSREMHCVMHGTIIMDSKETSSFQGDTAIHTESSGSLWTGLGGGNSTMIQDEKYVGSCPEGVQPGDVIEEEGKVTHLWKH